MSNTFTTRLGLKKPTPATGEPMDIDVLNANADLVDKWAGAILVNDGVTPSSAELFDGAIVKEKTSGKVWVAQKNIGGTFDKKFTNYPWSILGSGTATISSGTALTEVGIAFQGGVNSSVADIVGTRIIAPTAGIYDVNAVVSWDSTASVAGITRTASIVQNYGTVTAANSFTEVNQTKVESPLPTRQHTSGLFICAAGDTLSIAFWQNSGAPLGAFWYMTAALVSPS